jgi:hypothetical protein
MFSILISTENSEKPVNLILDTAAQVSILKKSMFNPNTIVYTNEKISISGITKQEISTYGVVKDKFFLDNEEILLDFHVVKDDFDIEADGILGLTFFKKFGKFEIDRKNNILILKTEKRNLCIKLHDLDNENILQNKERGNVEPQWKKNESMIMKRKTNIRLKPYDSGAGKSLKRKNEIIKIFKSKLINMLTNEVDSLRKCSRNNKEKPLVLNKKNIINSELFSVKSKLIKEKNIVGYPKLNSAIDAQILNPIEEKILIIPRGKKNESQLENKCKVESLYEKKDFIHNGIEQVKRCEKQIINKKLNSTNKQQDSLNKDYFNVFTSILDSHQKIPYTLKNNKSIQFLYHIIKPLHPLEDIKLLFINRGIENFVEYKQYPNTESNVGQKNNFNIGRNEILESELDLTHLSENVRKKFTKFCGTYNDIFHLGEPLTSTSVITHEVILEKDTAPINVKQYRLPHHLKEEIDKQIQEMLSENIIKPSFSSFNSPALLVKKKQNDPSEKPSYRLVIDFRKINEKTVAGTFPMPDIQTILDQLGNSTVFSTIDMSAGFWQIKMDEKSSHITSFSCGTKKYEFLRMPFGLKGAPSTFNKLISVVLDSLDFCFGFLDDIICYSENEEKHYIHLEEVFKRLRFYGLKLKAKKCNFFKENLIYLGHEISKAGVKPDQRLVDSVQKFPIPRTNKQIKSFLGMSGYYRKFICNYANLALPLTKQLGKDEVFKWTSEMENSFNALKERLVTRPILIYPDFSKEFHVITDASKYYVGAVLAQNRDSKEKPIAYASRKLGKAEINYSTIEKECLAVVWAVRLFRSYLLGKKFLVFSDAKALTWIFNVKDVGSRLLKFRLKLAEFDYEIKYIPGKLNVVADTLSRYPIDTKETREEKILAITRNQSKILKEKDQEIETHDISCDESDVEETTIDQACSYNDFLENGQQQQFYTDNVTDWHNKPDKDCVKVYFTDKNFTQCPEILKEELIVNKVTNTITKIEKNKKIDSLVIMNDQNICVMQCEQFFELILQLKLHCEKSSILKIAILTEFKYADQRMFSKIIRYVFKSGKIKVFLGNQKITITDQEEIGKIIAEFHNGSLHGHMGIEKTYNKVKDKYYFANMKEIITDYINKCKICQGCKSGTKINKIPMKISSTATKPFQIVFSDIVGPMTVTERENRYILTAQCALSKYVVAIPIPNQESETIASALVEYLILRFGLFSELSIVTDNGQNFVSKLFKEMCRLLSIKKLRTTIYHAQANNVERYHRALGDYLRCFASNDPLNWDKWIPFACFAYNTVKNSTTKFSPHELVFGSIPEIPTNLKKSPEIIYNYDDFILDLKHKFRKTHEIARKNIILSKENNKNYYDKKSNLVKFNVGQLVWMLDKNRINKLEGFKLGPYLVVEINSQENTTIKVGRQLKRVHNNLLSLYRE